MRTILVTIIAACLAACGAPPSGDEKELSLSEGRYAFTIADATTDTCWPADETWPPSGTTEVSLEATEAGFRLLAPEIIHWIFPPLDGTRLGDDLSAEGMVVSKVSETCTLEITATMTGAVIGPDNFRGNVSFHVNAGVDGSDCTSMKGEKMHVVIPFPALTDAATGTCDVTIPVTAFLK